MSARQLIAEVQALGGVLSIAGERLRIVSDDPVPEDLLARLKAAKAQVMDVVRRCGPSDVQRWRDFFDERAAILEYDAALNRAVAEANAFQHCVVRWLALHPPDDPGPRACCFCRLHAGADALVVLTGEGDLRRHVHGRCHAPMRAKRQQEATAAIDAALKATECN